MSGSLVSKTSISEGSIPPVRFVVRMARTSDFQRDDRTKVLYNWGIPCYVMLELSPALILPSDRVDRILEGFIPL
jgi:hypothetical protein